MGLADDAKRSPVDVAVLRTFLEFLGKYTEDMINIPSGKGLFHYTDLTGLRSMVSAGDLWLTDARYSNDSEEMLYGYRVAQELIASRIALAQAGNDSIEMSYLNAVATQLNKPQAEGVFISCFCIAGNLLSQWRGYGANGSGVSIEVEAPKFAAVTGPDSPHQGLMRLWRVFYDVAKQKELITAVLDFGYQRLEPIDLRATYAADAITFFVPTFKHADFSEENECRLIFTPPPSCMVKPDFRVARGMLVPYYSLKMLDSSFRLPIKKIVMGPAPNKALNAASVETMLKCHNYPGVSVESSGTPFRS